MTLTGLTSSELRHILASYRFRFENEAELQYAIASALTERQIAFSKEVPLGSRADRIDFLLPGGLGVEVKVDHVGSDVLRQLYRYAERAEIRELVLVTRRGVGNVGALLAGKPFHIIRLPLVLA